MNVPEQLATDASELGQMTGYEVEFVRSGNQVYVIVHAATLPPGAYTRAITDVLLITDAQYPMSAMDMFYMEPEIQHASGVVPSHASSIEQHAGRSWRRWSWHRNGVWKPGIDGLASHWAFVEQCWAQEVTR